MKPENTAVTTPVTARTRPTTGDPIAFDAAEPGMIVAFTPPGTTDRRPVVISGRAEGLVYLGDDLWASRDIWADLDVRLA